MIIVMKPNTTANELAEFINKLTWMNLQGIPIEENGIYSIAIVNGIDTHIDFTQFLLFPLVEKIVPLTKQCKLASREIKNKRTVIAIKDHLLGAGSVTVMAGPCSIESEEQIHAIAAVVKRDGAQILRGGAFKPRTSPYDFQGLGKIGLEYLSSAAKKNNLLSVSEVMEIKDLECVASTIDILQIGARNMQNFNLLKEAGKTGKPILLKRGLSATYMDFLLAAEYILQTGNPQVILCERGIRTFEPYARNTLDIAAVPILQELSHLPVIIDPSHGTGIRNAVPPMAYAAIAAGADGIMVEVHTDPDQALSDAKQTITPATFKEMMTVLRRVKEAVREVSDGK